MNYRTATLLNILFILVSVYSEEVFNTMPPPVNTSFTCRGRDTGFYADEETNCRVYHTCDDHGNKFTYYCPEETAFRQEALVCDHAHLVDCSRGRRVSVYTEEKIKKEESVSPRPRRVESVADESKGSSRINVDVSQSGNSNPSYTRSFRITAEPSVHLSAPKSSSKKQPTFVLNSSVFLRDRVNFQKSSPTPRDNRVPSVGSKTTENVEANENGAPNAFSGTFSTSTTTFKPSRAFGDSKDFRSRYFDKKEETATLGRVSSSTFRPFAADFNLKSDNSDRRSFDKKEGKVGFFGGNSSPVSTTTFRPFRSDSKDDGNDRTLTSFQLGRSNKKIDGFSSAPSSTTFRPFGADFKVQGSPGEVPSRMLSAPFDLEDKRSDGGAGYDGNSNKEVRYSGASSAKENEKKEGASRNWQNVGKAIERPSLHFANSNFPYSETLRSMQARSENSSPRDSSTMRPTKSTSAPTTKAGTEFPVHSFTGLLSPLVPNELEDDPYYPKRSTTTEAYFKFNDREKGAKRPFRFSTRRPWPGSFDFEIPEVLPDFNTLDDLVDRRKLFFIPRVKAT